MTVDFDLRAWEQQPEEGARPFQAFQFYRDADPSDRRVSEVANALGLPLATVRLWAREGDWDARARAWDVHRDRVRQRAFEQAAVEMAARQARFGEEIQSAGMEGVRHLLGQWEREKRRRDRDPSYEPSFPASPYAAAQMVRLGAEIERQARGVSDASRLIATVADVDVEGMRALLADESVREAARELVGRAEAARASQSRRVGAGDEPEVSGSPTS